MQILQTEGLGRPDRGGGVVRVIRILDRSRDRGESRREHCIDARDALRCQHRFEHAAQGLRTVAVDQGVDRV